MRSQKALSPINKGVHEFIMLAVRCGRPATQKSAAAIAQGQQRQRNARPQAPHRTCHHTANNIQLANIDISSYTQRDWPAFIV